MEAKTAWRCPCVRLVQRVAICLCAVLSAAGETTRTCAYDSQGRMRQVQCEGRTVTYSYDYLGRLYSRTESGGATTKYVYHGRQTVSEYGVVQKRYLVSGIDEVLAFRDGSVRYLHHDGLNNVTLATGISNEVIERVSCDAFGEPVFRDADYAPAETNASSIGNRHLFTGREWEPGIRLYQYRARFYSPATNGFLSNLGSFTNLGGGQYRATGITAAAATMQLQGLSFSMFTNIVIPVGTSRVTRMRLVINDGFAPPIDDLITSVIALNEYEGQVRPATTNLQANFGLAVDASYDYAMVGAPLASLKGPSAGAAFVYRWDPSTTNTWIQWRQLLPATVETNDEFGISVSMDRNRAAIGSIRDEGEGGLTNGTVYVFDRDADGADNWGQTFRIAPTNATNVLLFGQAVALDGDLLAVGAPESDLSGQGLRPGAVFLFQRDPGSSNWSEVMRWWPTNAAASNARLGWRLALDGDHLAAGAFQYNGTTGAVFRFHRNAGGVGAWGLAEIMTAPGTNPPTAFGLSVAVEDDTLAIGAPATTVRGTAGAGRVFVYRFDPASNLFVFGGDLERQADSVLNFGSSLAFDHGRLLIGARGNLTVTYPGSVYLFGPVSTNWVQIDRINRPSGSVAGSFGSSVGFNDGVAIVGAPVTLSPINNLGYAFLYRLEHNRQPSLLVQIPDQFAEVGVPFSYTLPSGLFADGDSGSTVALDVRFPDGSNGLSFASGVVSGTPVSGGVYRVVVIGSDDKGATSQVQFLTYVFDNTAFPDTPYNRWLLKHFSNEVFDAGLEISRWGPDADPDGDGRGNRQEYTFGGDPGVADNDEGLSLSLAVNGDLIVSYLRRGDDPSLRFQLQGTQDLWIWTDLYLQTVSETLDDVGDGLVRCNVRVRQQLAVTMLAYRVVEFE